MDVGAAFEADSGAPGPWLFHLAYDGLGRVIRKQSPWPPPDLTSSPVHTEHYYDGVRRIQEVIGEPQPEVIPQEPETLSRGEQSGLQGGSGNNGQNPAELVVERYFYDGIRRIQELWTDPVVIVAGGEPELDPQSMSGLEGASNPGSTPQPGEPAQTETWLEREYVYGPGSLGGGGTGGGLVGCGDESADRCGCRDAGGAVGRAGVGVRGGRWGIGAG